MRIIAGDLKGRRLFTPYDNRIRPTTDKVKESIFNIIVEYVEDSVVVDLFSGTGNLGLEAISRGAKRCYFGDKSRESMELTQKNISYCKVQEKCITIIGDYDKVLQKINERVDLIFLDPPYQQGILENSLELIARRSLLSEDGIIVAEHGTEEALPDKINELIKIKERKYGKTTITIYGYNLEE